MLNNLDNERTDINNLVPMGLFRVCGYILKQPCIYL